jgi:hypothetical protein
MASENHENSAETGAEMDYAEHNKTFGLFTGMTKWGTIIVVVILILMAMFLL